MLQTVKIGKSEYTAIKALAKKRGMLLQHLLNQAVKRFLASEQSKGQAA